MLREIEINSLPVSANIQLVGVSYNAAFFVNQRDDFITVELTKQDGTILDSSRLCYGWNSLHELVAGFGGFLALTTDDIYRSRWQDLQVTKASVESGDIKILFDDGVADG